MGHEDLRTVGRLASFLALFGGAILIAVVAGLCLPLDAVARFVPRPFVPTVLDLLEQGHWRAFEVHILYALYGGLLMGLGEILRRRVQTERHALHTQSYSSRSTRKST